jgi:hypothetical protein
MSGLTAIIACPDGKATTIRFASNWRGAFADIDIPVRSSDMSSEPLNARVEAFVPCMPRTYFKTVYNALN